MFKRLFLLAIVSTSMFVSQRAQAEASPYPDGYDRGYHEMLRLLDLAYSRPYAAPPGQFQQFVKAAQSSSGVDKWEAIKRLSGYRAKAWTAESVLRDIAEDSDPQTQFVAVLALVALGTFDEEIVAKVLVERLKSGDSVEQTYALRALKNANHEVSDVIREASSDLEQACAALVSTEQQTECRKLVAAS